MRTIDDPDKLTREEIRELVLDIAREPAWGYTRVLYELRKLGVRRISRNSVRRIMASATS